MYFLSLLNGRVNEWYTNQKCLQGTNVPENVIYKASIGSEKIS